MVRMVPETEFQIQDQYINLMLRYEDLVEDFLAGPLNIEHFHIDRKIIIYAILDCHEHGVVLKRKSFIDFAKNISSNTKQDISRQEVLFNQIAFLGADKNNYPMLKRNILDNYLHSTSTEYIRSFSRNKNEVGINSAIIDLSEKLSNLSDTFVDKKKIIYEDITKFSDEYWKRILDYRAGKIKKEFISTGFEEFDKTMIVGLAPGIFTLFCGDVGGYKSSMMINIAMNVWLKSKKNVLFVPLEMPRQLIQDKMVSRQTKISFDYVANPKSLSEEQIKKIEDLLFKDWKKEEGNLYIMESYDVDRIKVSLIQKEIKKRLEIFKPDLVVIDYIANLIPDINRQGRNDLEIGDMLKALRNMGRPGVVHDKGFSIISGAQIGREALKRVRRSPNDKMSFHSEDVRGSHEYSADADNIYVLFPDPQQPTEKLIVFAVKCRYGKNTFPGNQSKAVLDVNPELCLIKSVKDFYSGENADDILKKIDNDDLDFEEPVKNNDDDTDIGSLFD